MNILVILPSSPIKLLNKPVVRGLMSYQWILNQTNKQTDITTIDTCNIHLLKQTNKQTDITTIDTWTLIKTDKQTNRYYCYRYM